MIRERRFSGRALLPAAPGPNTSRRRAEASYFLRTALSEDERRLLRRAALQDRSSDLYRYASRAIGSLLGTHGIDPEELGMGLDEIWPHLLHDVA